MKLNRTCLVLILALSLLLTGCGKVTEAEEAIAAIGTVSMESEAAIIYAEQLLANMSEKQQAKVENLSVLTDAREEFDRKSSMISQTESAIAAIGNVTIDSGDAIQKAKNLYHALIGEKLDSYVSHLLPILEEAEKNYELAQIQAVYDDAVAIYNDQDYTEACSAFNDFIEAYPDSALISSAKEMAASCCVHLAKVLMEEEQYEKALFFIENIPTLYGADTYSEEFIQTRTELYNILEDLRPETGYTISDEIDSGYGEFILENQSEHDVCVKLENVEDPEQCIVFYVRSDETYEFNLADGSYLLKYAIGKYWFSDEDMFGENTGYVKASEPFEIETVYLSTSIQYSVMTYTINPSSGQGNSRTTDINPDDF